MIIEILTELVDEIKIKDGKFYIELHKIKGKRTWQFHKDDHDPPHGHDVETGDKLYLDTGYIYDKNGNLKSKLRDKELNRIKEELKGTHHDPNSSV